MHSYWGMLVGLVTNLFLLTAALAQQTLSSVELRELFVGKRAVFPYGVLELKPNGSVVFTWSDGRVERGKYTISDDNICRVYESSGKRCDRVVRDDQGFMLTTPAKAKVRFTIRESDALAEAPKAPLGRDQPTPDQQDVAGTQPDIGKALRDYAQSSTKTPLNLGGTVIASTYALQAWNDGNGGGEAILKYSSSHGWQVISMGGGAASVSDLVTGLGIPQSIAEQLLAGTKWRQAQTTPASPDQVQLGQSFNYTTTRPMGCQFDGNSPYGERAWRGPCVNGFAEGDGVIEWYVSQQWPVDGQTYFMRFRDETVNSSQGRTTRRGKLVYLPEVINPKIKTKVISCSVDYLEVRAEVDPALHPSWELLIGYIAYTVGLKCSPQQFAKRATVWMPVDGQDLYGREKAKSEGAYTAAKQRLASHLIELEKDRRAAKSAKREHFATMSDVKQWVSVEQLNANPFVFKNQIVGLAGRFVRMIAEDRAIFEIGTSSLVVSKLPSTQFRGNEQVVLALFVRGTTLVKLNGVDETVPDLEYVGSALCATNKCQDYFD